MTASQMRKTQRRAIQNEPLQRLHFKFRLSEPVLGLLIMTCAQFRSYNQIPTMKVPRISVLGQFGGSQQNALLMLFFIYDVFVSS